MSTPTSVASPPVAPVAADGRWRLAASLHRWLPTGDALPAASYRARHRQICGVLWAHAVGLLVAAVALIARGGETHLLAEAGLIFLLAFAASRGGRSTKTSSVMATLGLFGSSAVATHMANGQIEAHFHFFVMVVLVSLYQSWLPFLVGLGFVLVHHGIGGALPGTVVFNHVDGATDPWKWTVIHALFILAESVACLVAWRVNEDALSRERSGRALMEKANEDLALAQELSRIGSWEVDLSTGEVTWSREMFRMMAVPPATVPAYELLLAHAHPDDRARLEVEVANMAAAKEPVEFEHRMLADGREVTVRTRSMPVVRDGALVKLAGTSQDVTEHRRLEREIEHRAFHDPLTGLGNRTLFLDRLAHALALRARSDAPLTALYLDLDDFKAVNDSMGHGAGDALLMAVAKRLTGSVRPADTVARLGGDEFALLLENTDLEAAEATAARILESFTLPVALEQRDVTVRASVGVAAVTRGMTAEDLLRHADTAMYAAKRGGKAGYRSFATPMPPAAVEGGKHVAPLRTAV